MTKMINDEFHLHNFTFPDFDIMNKKTLVMMANRASPCFGAACSKTKYKSLDRPQLVTILFNISEEHKKIRNSTQDFWTEQINAFYLNHFSKEDLELMTKGTLVLLFKLMFREDTLYKWFNNIDVKHPHYSLEYLDQANFLHSRKINDLIEVLLKNKEVHMKLLETVEDVMRDPTFNYFPKIIEEEVVDSIKEEVVDSDEEIIDNEDLIFMIGELKSELNKKSKEEIAKNKYILYLEAKIKNVQDIVSHPLNQNKQ